MKFIYYFIFFYTITLNYISNSLPLDFCTNQDLINNLCEIDGCNTNFQNTEEDRYCKSQCENQFYWDIIQSECIPNCITSQIQNDNHLTCTDVQACPLFNEVGQFKIQGEISFVIPDSTNNQIIIVFDAYIQIYSYTTYQLVKQFPKQNDNKIIYIKKIDDILLTITQGCDQFKWDYINGIILESLNLKQDGYCTFYNEVINTVYGYKSDNFYTINYETKVVNNYSNPNKNITNIVGIDNIIYTTDVSSIVKKWDLSDTTVQPIDINSSAFQQEIVDLKAIQIGTDVYSLIYFKYITGIPGTGPQIFIGKEGTEQFLDVTGLVENIIDIKIEQGAQRLTIIAENSIIMYSIPTILTSFTAQNTFNIQQKQYIISNNHVFLVYENTFKEFDISGTPDFTTGQINQITLKNSKINGIVFDDSVTGSEKLLVYSDQLVIINHNNGNIINKIANFPQPQKSQLSTSISYLFYESSTNTILAGSESGDISIIQDTQLGTISDIKNNPSYTDIYSKTDNKVLKIILNASHIYVLYQDKTLGVFQIDTLENIAHEDFSVQIVGDVLDLQFDLNNANSLFINTEDQLFSVDISTPASPATPVNIDTTAASWSNFYQTSTYFYSVKVDTFVRIWDVSNLATVSDYTLLAGENPIEVSTFDQSSGKILVGSKTGTTLLFEEVGGTLTKLKTFSYTDSPINKPIVANIIFDESRNEVVTFHQDGLTIFWNYASESEAKMITFLKPTEIVKSVTQDTRFFTVLNKFTESEVIEWDWSSNQIFSTISKYQKLITALEVIPEHQQLLIGFQDGTISSKQYEKNITQIETGFSTLNGITLIQELQLLITYTNILQKWDYPYKKDLGVFATYHLERITGVKVVLDVGGVNYLVSYNADTTKNLAVWNIDTKAKIGDQNGFHTQAVKQVVVANDRIITSGIDLNIVITYLVDGTKVYEILSHTSSIKQIGLFNNILISFDSSQKLFFHDYSSPTFDSLQPAETIDQIQGFLIDEDKQMVYVYSLNIQIYDLQNSAQSIEVIESGLPNNNIINKMYVEGKYIFLHDRESVVVKDRYIYVNTLNNALTPSRIDVQKVIINIDTSIIVVYSQSEGFEEIFIYNFITGQLIKSLLSSQSLFSGRNYDVILDIANDFIIKLNENNLIMWDMYKGQVTNFMGYQHETNNLKGAYLDKTTNTMISYDVDKVVYWDYSNFIKPTETLLPRKQNISVNKMTGTNDLYYSDQDANVYKYDILTQELTFLITLSVKPKYLLAKQSLIICDQGNDIILYSNDLQTIHQTISSATISPVSIISDPQITDTIFIITRQNDVHVYTVNSNTLNSVHINTLHTSKITDCKFNLKNGFQHLICYDYGGGLSIINFASGSYSQVGGYQQTNGSEPIRGIDIHVSKLIVYSNEVTVFGTYSQTTLSGDTAATYVSPQLVIDDVANDGSNIFVAQGLNKILWVHQISNFNTLSNTKFILPSQDHSKVSVSSIYSRIAIYCDFQINIYKNSDSKLVNIYRQSKQVKDILSVEFIAQDTSGPEVIDYLLVIRDSGLFIFKVSLSEFIIILQFPLVQPQIIEKTITFDPLTQNLNLIILGASKDKIFNYNQQFTVQTTQVNQKNDCSIDFTDSDKSIIEKKFWQLENSLDKQGSTIKNVQINFIQDTSTQFSYTQAFQQSEREIDLVYRLVNNPTQKVLDISAYSFANYTLPKLQLIDFDMNFGNIQNINVIVNENIEKLKLVNINLIGQFNNVMFYINGIQDVFIHTLTLEGLTFTDTTAIRIENAEAVYIENLICSNLQFQNSTLIDIINIKSVIINTITVTNCQMDELSLELIKFVQIENLDFQNIIATGNQYSGTQKSSLIYFGGVEISHIETITFNNNILFSFLYYKNFYDYNKKTITLTKDECEIVTGTFDGNTMNNSLLDFTGFKIIISQLTFNNNQCETCFGSSIKYVSSHYSLTQSIFTNNQAQYGGAVYIKDTLNTVTELNTMDSCTFTGNNAVGSGGAIHLNNADLKFVNNASSVTGNNAMLGGGIRYLNRVPQFIDSVQQRRNLAYNFLIINGNTGSVMGNNIGSYPASIRISSETQKIIGDQWLPRQQNDPYQLIYEYDGGQLASGNIMQIKAEFYDEEDQKINVPQNYNQDPLIPASIVDELQEYQLSIFSNSTNIEVEGDVFKSPSSFNDEFQYVVDEMIVHSIPGQSEFYYITSPSIRKVQLTGNGFAEGPFVVKINVHFRNCVIGEILDNKHGRLKRCYECPFGKYSLEEPGNNEDLKCLPCPFQAIDCYGSNILLKNDYWRESNTTDIIEECKNKKENCKAEKIPQSEEIKWGDNICIEGHIGPLCEECDTYGVKWDTAYKKDINYSCLSCNDTSGTSFILPIIVFFIFIIFYIIFAIRVAIRLSANISLGYYLRKSRWISVGTSAVKDYSPFNIKQFMHYLQISKYANTYYLYLPAWITFIPDLISIPIEFIMSSLDCAVSGIDSVPIVYLRAIWSLIIPIIYILICLIIYSILLIFKKLRHSKNYMFNGMTFLMLFLQPGEVQILIQVLSCRTIAGKQYITADLNYQCYTDEHIKYIFILIIPALIVWMIIIPAWILYGLVKSAKQKQLDNCIIRFKYGFLYQEYKYKHYYWEYIRLYKKLFIVIINSFYNAHNETKLIITGLAILSYYVISKKIQPYALPRYNNMDHWSMRIIMVLIYLNLLMEHNEVYWIMILAFILIIMLNQGWFLYLFFNVIWTKFLHLYGNQYNDGKQHLINKIPCLKKILKVEKRQTMRVFENWKKARKLGRDLAARRIKQLQQTNFYEAAQNNLDSQRQLIGGNEDLNTIDNKSINTNRVYPSNNIAESVNSSTINLKNNNTILSALRSKKPSSAFPEKNQEKEINIELQNYKQNQLDEDQIIKFDDDDDNNENYDINDDNKEKVINDDLNFNPNKDQNENDINFDNDENDIKNSNNNQQNDDAHDI